MGSDLYFKCRLSTEWNCKSPVGFDQQGTAAITKRELVKCLTKLTNCTTWCFPAPSECLWEKAGIRKLQMFVWVTEITLQHLGKRKPADWGVQWCQRLSLVAGTRFSVFKHCSKTAHSSKSSKHAGVGLQIPCHPCSSICYLTGITKKLERCASVILKLTSGLKENICLECRLNEVWCYLWDQMPIEHF